MRAKVPISSCREEIRLRTGEDDESAMECPDSKDRAERPITLDEERSRIACHTDGVAGKRQPRRLRNLSGPASDGRACLVRRRAPAQGVGDRPADQIHPPHQRDPFRHLVQIGPGQDPLEHAAGIGQADDCDVPRIRYLVVEQHPHDPQPDVLHHHPVVRPVAAGARHPAREEIRPAGFGFENAAPRQPGVPRDVGQGGIEQVVPERRRVGHDAVFEGELHQHRTSEDDAQRVRRVIGRQLSPAFVEYEQQKLFGQPQHSADSSAMRRPSGMNRTGIRIGTIVTRAALHEAGPRFTGRESPIVHRVQLISFPGVTQRILWRRCACIRSCRCCRAR